MPLMQGAKKYWGSETNDIWCCHCTLVQANSMLHEHIFYMNPTGITVAQNIPARVALQYSNVTISLEQTEMQQTGGEMMRDHAINRTVLSRPHELMIKLQMKVSEPAAFDLSVRVPDWSIGDIEICVNG